MKTSFSADTDHEPSVYMRTYYHLHVNIFDLIYNLTANVLWSHFNTITPAHTDLETCPQSTQLGEDTPRYLLVTQEGPSKNHV